MSQDKGFAEALAQEEVDKAAVKENERVYALKQTVAKLTKERDSMGHLLSVSRKEQSEIALEMTLFHGEYEGAPGWLADTAGGDNHATLLAQFSDWHYGEFVDPAQMDNYNSYNTDIAIKRTQRFFGKSVMMPRNYLAGVEYDGFVLVLGGDLVSGSIHDELERTNELSIYESIEFAVRQMIPGIEMLAEEFGSVHLVSAPGNHGRFWRKVQHKDYSANNADTHIARLLALHFQGEDSITFQIPATYDADFSIYASRFYTEHGQSFRSAGSPEIGSIGPITRGVLRTQSQKLAEGKPFDYALIHHFHQYISAASKGYSTNGAGKGYDEYARGEHFKPEQAQQALMLVTPEHGVSVQMPIIVSDREAEGW